MLRKVDTSVRAGFSRMWRLWGPQGAGACLSDINDRQAHRRADCSSLLSPFINPGWE